LEVIIVDRIEEALNDKKAEIEDMEAPVEMEQLLKKALQGRRKKIGYGPAAAVLIAVLIFTYNFDALAYYGKKITGYDHMTVGALSRLNEEGMGQEIGKSCLFSNGVEITIDGIMFDDNELVVFYKAHHSGGKLQEILGSNLPRLHISGIKPFGYHGRYGKGTFIDDNTMTYIEAMESPRFYEKWLEIEISMIIGNKTETQSVRFVLDRTKAMKRTAKLTLKAEAGLGDYKVIFDEFTASAMSSQLNGRIIPQTDAARKAFMPETAEGSTGIPYLEFDIVTDIGKVTQFSGGMSVCDGSITFTERSDALPEGFSTLQIRNIRMDSLKLVDKAVDLDMDTEGIFVTEDLIVNRVYRDGTDLCLSVSSRGIPEIGLFSGEEQLEQVNYDELELEPESAEPAERVLRFRENGETADHAGLKLEVKFIRYTTITADTVDIPAE
jgi:hypothetical protein